MSAPPEEPRPALVTVRDVERIRLTYGPASAGDSERFAKTEKNDIEHDLVAVEAPLSIVVEFDDPVAPGERIERLVATTMRTPGDDEALALGFTVAEGVLDHTTVRSVRGCTSQERVRVLAEAGHQPRLDETRRLGLVTSACGVCGREALERVAENAVAGVDLTMRASALADAANALLASQAGFRHTGGLHAAALVDPSGQPRLVREDVGRHNALDKVLGAALLGGLDLGRHGLVMTSRASYELVQKASRLGVPLLATVGAPSSLAVDTAARAGLSLVCFLREGRMNLYTRGDRIES